MSLRTDFVVSVKSSVGQSIGIASFITFTYILLTSIIFDELFREKVFYFHIGTFYPYFLVLGVILFIIAGLMFYRAFKNEHSSLFILIFVIFLSGLSYFFGFLNFDPSGTVDFRQTRFFQLQVLTQSISIYLLYIHFELNSKDHPRTNLFFLITLLFTPYSFQNLIYLITDDYTESLSLETFNFISVLMLQIGVFIVFTWIFRTALKIFHIVERRGVQARRLAQFQLIGITILIIGVVFQSVENLTDFDVWHTPLNTIAIFMIGYAYFKDPKTLLLAPINVYLFGIVDNTGRTLYYNPIDPSFAEDGDNSQLFGGLTIAFTSFGKEVAKADQGIDSLKFGDRSIIVEFNHPYYLVVIANQSSFFLQQEMMEYLDDLKMVFPEVPQGGAVLPKNTIDDLNSKFFPII